MILKRDVMKKIEKIKKRFPKLEVSINGRRRSVYINGVFFTYEEIIALELNKFKLPSTWEVWIDSLLSPPAKVH